MSAAPTTDAIRIDSIPPTTGRPGSGDVDTTRNADGSTTVSVSVGDLALISARVSCLGKLALIEPLQGSRFDAAAPAREEIALCRIHKTTSFEHLGPVGVAVP